MPRIISYAALFLHGSLMNPELIAPKRMLTLTTSQGGLLWENLHIFGCSSVTTFFSRLCRARKPEAWIVNVWDDFDFYWEAYLSYDKGMLRSQCEMRGPSAVAVLEVI